MSMFSVNVHARGTIPVDPDAFDAEMDQLVEYLRDRRLPSVKTALMGDVQGELSVIWDAIDRFLDRR